MNITAELNNKELTIVVGDEQKEKFTFYIEEMPFIGMFEYEEETFDVELDPFGLWIGQEGALQNYLLTIK